eukprot:6177597-Pleurochrysis_carterae.AAC.2
MLAADKNALVYDTKVRLLRVRERELNLYIANCRAVGTGSALLAGFAYFGLVSSQRPPRAQHRAAPRARVQARARAKAFPLPPLQCPFPSPLSLFPVPPHPLPSLLARSCLTCARCAGALADLH